MTMWIVFGITLASHIGLIFIYERQRRQLDSLRGALKRHRQTIARMESQLRIASGKLFK